MSKLAALLGSNGGLAATAAVVAVAAVGGGLYVSNQTATTPPAVVQPIVEASQDIAAAPAPAPVEDVAAQDVAVAASTPDIPPVPTAAATVSPPSIDEVRIEPDGFAVIAGRAVPGSKVTVLLDGVANTEVTTDTAGGFAAVTLFAPNPEAQILTVSQRMDGTDTASLDEVIVAPVVRGEPKVAAVEPSENSAPSEPEDTPVVAAEPDLPTQEQTAEATTQRAEEVVAALAPPPAPEPQAAPTQDAPADNTPVSEPTVTAQAEPTVPVQAEAPAPVTPPAEAAETPKPQVVAEVSRPAAPQPAAAAIESPEPEVETQVVASRTPDPAPTTVTLLKSDEDGVQILGTTPPEVLENIEIDSISYSQSGEVQLAGRAQSEAEVVRVYVNNRPVTELEVDTTGRWRGDLPEIDTGVYTLRVDEVDAGGAVTSRVETPFQREDPALLAQADDPQKAAKRITVQTGNSLWAIARERYGDGRLYVQVFESNKDNIRNPDLIFPGQVFELPD